MPPKCGSVPPLTQLLATGTLKEQPGYRHEVVDWQRAHAPKENLQIAYDRANYLDERRETIQHWADCIDHVAAEVHQAESCIL